MAKYIPLSVPNISGNEWKYVKECLDTGWVSSVGKFVNLFEKKICEYTGSKYAVACVNGTSALHISLLLSGVKPGDEVIVPDITFIATINSVRYVNANPIFMDCDDFYNIDCEKTVNFIIKKTAFRNGFSYNKITNKKISAIIPVHVFGNAVNLELIYDICRERNIKIIEDSAESIGTKYVKGKFKNHHAGTIGDFGCLSFNGNKIITTGGGGILLTDNPDYADKALYYTTQAKDDNINFIHNNVGYNYRLTNIQAALGVAQLEKIDDFIKIKKTNYEYYKIKIADIQGLKLSLLPAYSQNNYWMYALQINEKKFTLSKDELLIYLNRNNVESRPIWYPNHLQKPFRKCQNYRIEKAVELHKKTLNIPCSSNLTKDNIDYIVSLIKKACL